MFGLQTNPSLALIVSLQITFGLAQTEQLDLPRGCAGQSSSSDSQLIFRTLETPSIVQDNPVNSLQEGKGKLTTPIKSSTDYHPYPLAYFDPRFGGLLPIPVPYFPSNTIFNSQPRIIRTEIRSPRRFRTIGGIRRQLLNDPSTDEESARIQHLDNKRSARQYAANYDEPLADHSQQRPCPDTVDFNQRQQPYEHYTQTSDNYRMNPTIPNQLHHQHRQNFDHQHLNYQHLDHQHVDQSAADYNNSPQQQQQQDQQQEQPTDASISSATPSVLSSSGANLDSLPPQVKEFMELIPQILACQETGQVPRFARYIKTPTTYNRLRPYYGIRARHPAMYY